MPSVAVPPFESAGWSRLMVQRRAFWAKESNEALSPHFHAAEFACHDGSLVPITARPGLVALCRVFLEPMRSKFGACYVLSGYRHVAYNADIGGARHSQHIYEESFESVAADLRFAKGTPAQWSAEAKRLRTSRNRGHGGVGRYDRAGFVHVDNRPYKADWVG
jgi:Peptidase M15